MIWCICAGSIARASRRGSRHAAAVRRSSRCAGRNRVIAAVRLTAHSCSNGCESVQPPAISSSRFGAPDSCSNRHVQAAAPARVSTTRREGLGGIARTRCARRARTSPAGTAPFVETTRHWPDCSSSRAAGVSRIAASVATIRRQADSKSGMAANAASRARNGSCWSDDRRGFSDIRGTSTEHPRTLVASDTIGLRPFQRGEAESGRIEPLA